MLNNRYDFMFLFDAMLANPNGDPDAGNMPRMDPEDRHGLVSDVMLKRRIRNYVVAKHDCDSPNDIFVQENTNLNKLIARAHRETGCDDKEKKPKRVKGKDEDGEDASSSANNVSVARKRDFMCKNYWDIRTFGAVLSTGANAGQVLGPVQLTFGRSVDPVLPMDICISSCAVRIGKSGMSEQEHQDVEDREPHDKLHTLGRKQLIPYGLFVARGFVSANLANKVGFTEQDLELLWESLINMFDHNRTASKGYMSARKLFVFKHLGRAKPGDNEQSKINSAKLGSCPAQLLLDNNRVVKIKANTSCPREWSDYTVELDKSLIPDGVELIEML